MNPRAAEAMVQRCYEQMLAASEFGIRMHWWQRMAHYIKRREPAVVWDMERRMGLRR